MIETAAVVGALDFAPAPAAACFAGVVINALITAAIARYPREPGTSERGIAAVITALCRG